MKLLPNKELLKSAVPVCLQNRKIYHIFTLTVDIQKTLYTLDDIYQQMLLAKFYENLTLAEGVDSIILGAQSKTESNPSG